MKRHRGFKEARKVFAGAVFAVLLLALLLLLYDAGIVPIDVRAYPRSTVTLDRANEVLNVRLSAADEWCIPVSLDKMGAWTARVAVELEDKRFYEHRGVDFIAILRALYYNLREREVVSGASTITTQVIRIAAPRPRTYAAKLSEFWQAMRLENKSSKPEILELYLNRAPFGGNIRGIEAASRAYFGKNAQSLSLSESVLLISILRAPSRYRPDQHAEEARALRDRSLLLLRKRGVITQEMLEIARSDIPTGRRYPLPRYAAMASTHAIAAERAAVVRSTISSALQTALEKNLEKALLTYPSEITAASVIVENESGEILAYVGNARADSGLPASDVDCGNALRSPGSTLKPFIYAAAFERGLLTPASLLADTPLAFQGSAPRNFDRSYRGPVSARTALASSLNAPAVRVLRRLGYPSAIGALRRFGFANINRDSEYYTDSLILGGCEVTLLQLAAAYRTLAQSGIYSPLKWTWTPDAPTSVAASGAASYLTLDILRDTERLIPLYRDLFSSGNENFSFKTGTSHGLRDAWCVGVSKGYTVAVWLGVPEGKASERLIGLQSAMPIVMQLIRELPEANTAPRGVPENIYERTVCAVSGMLPTNDCLYRTSDLAIRNVSSMELCKIHQRMNGEVLTMWPSELANWIRVADEDAPPSASVTITRPLPRSKYFLDSQQESLSILFSAEGPLPHYWYLDGKFLTTDHKGDGIFVDVGRGTHVVSVLSGARTNRSVFEVREHANKKEDTPEGGVLD